MPDLETVIPVWELWFLNGIRMVCSSFDLFLAKHDTKDYHVVMPHTRYFSWTLTKMKRLLQGCSPVAATMQQSNMYATTGGNKVAN